MTIWSKDNAEIIKSQLHAHRLATVAIRNGKLIRPSNCELCGRSDKLPKEEERFWIRRSMKHTIGAHHWRGYDYPLDVWWVCEQCNRKLGSSHDGSLTHEQARALVALGYRKNT